jgi:hypothetical protein
MKAIQKIFQFYMLVIFGSIVYSCIGSTSTDTKEPTITDIDTFLSPNPENIVFTNANLITMTSDEVLLRQDLYVRGGLVEKILPSQDGNDYSGYRRIQANGTYLMPGMGNMYVHLLSSYYSNYKKDLFLHLAHGITTVRSMWGSDFQVGLRDSIENGLILGPTMYVASPGFDGSRGVWPGSVITKNAKEVRDKVAEFDQKNYDFIKVYSGLSSEEYFALLDEAEIMGIRPIGHIPFTVPISTILDHNQKSISHLQGYAVWVNQISDWNRIRSLAKKTAASKTWSCPTLSVVNRETGQINDFKNSSEMSHISPEYRSFMTSGGTQPVVSDASMMHQQRLRFIGLLHEMNANILVCTDTGLRYVFPGFTFFEELQYYQQAGLSNYEVLKTATVNMGNYLGNDKLGVIRQGAQADLIMLRENPLDDIEALETREGVMTKGTWFPKNKIDEVLHGIVNSYK